MKNNFMKFVGCVCAAAIPIAFAISQNNEASLIALIALIVIAVIARD